MGRVVKLPGRAPIDYDSLSAADREVVEAMLAQWLVEVDANPLQGIEPFGVGGGSEGAQIGFLLEPRVPGKVSVKMAHAGNQAGKTMIGCVDDVIQCVPRSFLPSWMLPFKHWDEPFKCRVITMDLEGTLHGVMLPKFQEVVPKAALLGGKWDKAYDKSNRVLRFECGSTVQFMSASQEREKHQGWTGDRVRFDEEPPPPNGYPIYRESRMRVVARAGQIVFTMTPLVGAGMTWTYDEVYCKRDDPEVSTHQWSMFDNPFLPKSVVEQELASIKNDKEKRARVFGDFVAFRGRVLEEFDPNTHVVDGFSRTDLEGCEVLIGYDPGIRRGGVVWCAFDERNNMTVFDELYPERMSVTAVSEAIRAKNAYWRVKPSYIVIDPAAATPSTVTARESVQSELQRLGWAVVPGQNSRLPGILELKGRLESGSLKVSAACVEWLRECDRWLVAADEETSEGRPKTGKGTSFATLGPDHLMDPTRYVAMDRIWVRPPTAGPEDLRKRHWEPGRAPHGGWLRAPAPAGPPMGSMS